MAPNQIPGTERSRVVWRVKRRRVRKAVEAGIGRLQRASDGRRCRTEGSEKGNDDQIKRSQLVNQGIRAGQAWSV